MTTEGMSLVGVNLSGAEFGSGTHYGWNYIYPNDAEIDYYASKGVNVIRLPFLWERLQPTLNGPLDSDELARIDSVVSYAASKGVQVILDPHDYGGYGGNLVGSSAVPNSAFASFWGQLADHFKAAGNVMFGLMNEPNQQTATSWLQSENAAIASIRQAGATQEILVQGSYWDGGASWTTSDNAAVIGTGIVDPANNYAFEVHEYLDSDASGTHANVVSTSVGVDRLTAITNWAEQNGARLFLGEFGVAQDQTSLTAMQNMLSYMSQHSDVWQGATYWGAGPWWGNYMYSIEPSDGTDKPQMTVLEQFTPTGMAAAAAAAAEAAAAAALAAAGVSDPAAGSTPVVTPAVPVTMALSADTGTNAADQITSNPAVTGTGAANAVVDLTIDGTAVTASVTADANGAWSYAPVGLADGAHVVMASETGTGGTSSASLTFTLDTTAPTPTIVGTGGSVTTGTQTVRGTGEIGSVLTLFSGTTALASPVTVGSDGTWSAAVSLHLGSTVIKAQAVDAAGNTAGGQSVTYNYDHPPVFISGGGGMTATYAMAGGTRSVTTVKASDADPGDTVSYALLDSQGRHVTTLNGLVINPQSGALSFANLPRTGNYTVTAVASDTHGGSTTQTLKIKVGAGTFATGDTGDRGVTDTFVFNGSSARLDVQNFRVADVIHAGSTDPHSVLALAHTLFNGVAAGASGNGVMAILASHSRQIGADTLITSDQHTMIDLRNVNRAALLAHPSNFTFT